MGKIFLNEGTEITVKESRAEIRKKIQYKVFQEKANKKDTNFIEVTRIKSFLFFRKEIKLDLYAKRILFIYD